MIYWKMTIEISDKLHDELMEVSLAILRPEFKGLTIQFLPEELFPDRLHNALRMYLLDTIRSVHMMKRDDESIQ